MSLDPVINDVLTREVPLRTEPNTLRTRCSVDCRPPTGDTRIGVCRRADKPRPKERP